MKKIFLSLAIFILLSISAFALQPIVIDAINYEKPVVTADYLLKSGFNQGDFGSHSIRIPKITVDTSTTQIINQEMYEIGKNAYERLINNEESGTIYDYDYVYKEENGIIGIVITEFVAVQAGGGNMDYKAFYYDKYNDEQLSFYEYLSALEVKKSDLSNNAAIIQKYREAGQPDEPINVLDAILDAKSSDVFIELPWSMNGWMEIQSNTPLVNIEIKDPTELYTGKTNEIVMTVGSKTAYASGNTVEIDVEPIISNGRTMLPARFVAEELGASVEWDESSRKVVIQKDALKIELVVDSSIAYVNGREVALDSPVFIRNGRTYTPVRFVAEKLGAKVEWIKRTKQVVITHYSLNVGYAAYIEKDYETDDERYKTNYVIVPEIKRNTETEKVINAKMREFF